MLQVLEVFTDVDLAINRQAAWCSASTALADHLLRLLADVEEPLRRVMPEFSG